MQISDLNQQLQTDVINELNTIESVETIDYINGKLTAVNHALNKAAGLSTQGNLDQQGITDLIQFCNDRLEIFKNLVNELDKGLHDGYLAVKNYILSN